MVITLVQPTAGYIGQGHELIASSSLSVPGGFAQFQIFDALIAIQLTAGDTLTGAAGIPFGATLGILGGLFVRGNQGLPPGTAVTLQITVLQPDGATLI